MKNLILLFLSLILVQNLGFSQENKLDFNKRYTDNSLFLFNSFYNGSAYFNDGGVSDAKYNYNVVYDKVCYLSNNQIFEISNASELDSLVIGNLTFYCNEEKIYEIIKHGKIDILMARKADLSVNKPEGAYGTTSSTSAVSKKTSLYTGKGIYGGEHVNIQNDSDTEYPVANKYYLLVNNEVIIATKFQINKTFPDHKSEVKEFLKENKINFQVIDDLSKLASFLEEFI